MENISKCVHTDKRASRRRNDTERLITLIVPIRPYRCLGCQARFWSPIQMHATNEYIKSFIPGTLIFVLFCFVIAFTLKVSFSEKNEHLTAATIDEQNQTVVEEPERYIIENANFQSQNLSWADLSEKHFKGANFEKVRLVRANLSNTVLVESNFKDADLRHTQMAWATLDAVNFEGADLSDASMKWAVLNEVNFLSANINQTRFEEANLSNSKGLTQIQLDQACGNNMTILPEGLTIPRCR